MRTSYCHGGGLKKGKIRFRGRLALFLAASLLCAGTSLAKDYSGEKMDNQRMNSPETGANIPYAALDQSDQDLAAIAGDIFQTGRGEKSLDAKTRALLELVALAASHAADGLAAAAGQALDSGASPVEIKECLYQIVPYVGLPRVVEALGPVNELFGRRGIKTPRESRATVSQESRFADGLAVQKKIFGSQAIENMQKSAPAGQREIVTDMLSSWCFGDFYTRKGLDLKMRELVTFCAIVALGGCDPQARAHAGANISVGNSKQNLVDALAVMLPYIGFPRTLNGLAALNAAAPE